MENNHVKRIGLIRRKPSLTHEAFVSHWLNVHAPMARSLPGLRRYCVNFVDRDRFPKFGYDGFSELWFDSEADLVKAFESPQGVALLADLANFTEEIYPLVVQERRQVWP